ncbi:hypothetical protein [Bradyrhizobium sp. URHC0002]
MLRVDRLAGRCDPVMALISEPACDIKNKPDDGLIFLRGLRLRFIPERGKFTIAGKSTGDGRFLLAT